MKCVRLLRKMSEVNGSKRGMVIRVSDDEASRLHAENIADYETRSAWRRKGRAVIENGQIATQTRGGAW